MDLGIGSLSIQKLSPHCEKTRSQSVEKPIDKQTAGLVTTLGSSSADKLAKAFPHLIPWADRCTRARLFHPLDPGP